MTTAPPLPPPPGESPAVPRPFARFEWQIAWRYLRAGRATGGVSVMTWISLIGVTLAVFALIATMAVRAGFRAEFVDTILGANAHVTIYPAGVTRVIETPEALATRLRSVPGVVRAAPLVRAQVLAAFDGRTTGLEVLGIAPADLAGLRRIVDPETGYGDPDRLGQGIALGRGVAQTLGVGIGDRIRLIAPEGMRTAFGTSPRTGAFEVVYIFEAGRYDIDRTRAYLPLDQAQRFFNRDGVADEIEIMLADPDHPDRLAAPLAAAAGVPVLIWSWQDASGAFLRALQIEDNVMFVILSVLVLIAAMNIVSGLVMLVRNKRRDIGILRTMGFGEGTVMRVFFLCGALVGVAGTALGTALGVVFASYIDPILALVNWFSGGDVWDPAIRGIYALPAEIRPWDVGRAVALSLGLSLGVTLWPARRAARLDPVEALRDA